MVIGKEILISVIFLLKAKNFPYARNGRRLRKSHSAQYHHGLTFRITNGGWAVSTYTDGMNEKLSPKSSTPIVNP